MLPRSDFFRPVPEASLPHQQAFKQRAIAPIAAVLALLSAGDSVLELATGVGIPGRVLGELSFSLTVYALVGWSSRGRVGARHPEPLLFLLNQHLLWMVATNGWVRVDHRSELSTYAAVVPLLVSLFVPWRPGYSLGLGALALVAYAAADALGAPIEMPVSTLSYVTVAIAVTSAVGNQVQRHIWLEFETTRQQLVASDRMSSLGRLTAGVAHELKTPLAAAMNGLERLRSLGGELRESAGHPQVTADDLREIAAEIDASAVAADASVRRATQFIHAIRAHTLQLSETRREAFLVADTVSATVTLLSHATRRAGVSVDTTGVDPGAEAVGDPGKLGQILTNLVGNAVDACAGGGAGKRVTVTARADDGGILLVVEDDGPGVPEAIRARVFEPLFTTKADQNGTGLGLSISRDLAEGAFGGSLRLAASDRGARFELRLPGRAAPARAGEAWTPMQAA